MALVVLLLLELTCTRLHQIDEQVFASRVRRTQQVGLVEQFVQQFEALLLVAGHQRLALALLPAIAIGRWRARLDLAVVAFVACARTLRATAQVAHESARATLEYVLRDVVLAGPRETARVVRAKHEQWRLVGARAQWEYHACEEQIASVIRLLMQEGHLGSHAQRRVQDVHGGVVGAQVHRVHERRGAVCVLVRQELVQMAHVSARRYTAAAAAEFASEQRCGQQQL